MQSKYRKTIKPLVRTMSMPKFSRIVEQEVSGLNLLTSLFNAIYTTGKISSDWLKSTFIILSKTHTSLTAMITE